MNLYTHLFSSSHFFVFLSYFKINSAISADNGSDAQLARLHRLNAHKESQVQLIDELEEREQQAANFFSTAVQAARAVPRHVLGIAKTNSKLSLGSSRQFVERSPSRDDTKGKEEAN